ncbi:MAG: gamma-glutamyltransferase [Chloroflexi bacterium]|nr:gamma-glutamyltransferase [Chloroflexota bacterium]MDA1270789.1 gamma-glutamyltransferase [Chloroflexota bacterium]
MASGRLSRQVVYGKNGMVCTNSPLSATAGLKALQEGGNAFDAALAVAATETVTMVPMCGIGGDSFILAYEAQNCQVTGISSAGVAGSGASADYYRRQGLTKMPLEGPHSVGVPGEVAAWEEFHRRFCSKPFEGLLETAIGYSEEGFPVPPKIAQSFKSTAQRLAGFPSTAEVLLAGGRTPGEGDLLANPDLAQSLRRIASGGAEEFYKGDLARRMVKALNDAGGLFTAQDFANHEVDVYDPIGTTYRGETVYQTRPPSQGFVHLEMLNLIEGFDLSHLSSDDPEAIHLMVEAKKIAYDDRNRLAADPRVLEWPLEEVISKAYADRRRTEIRPDRVGGESPTLDGAKSDGNTTYFCVADGAGNAVSWVHSLSHGFGSRFMAKGTGVLFNNRAGRGFSLEAGHPNEFAPNKRTMHTLNCYLTLRGGKAHIVGGTPGGDFQPQSGTQIITNLLDFGMGPQESVDAPRWWSYPGTDPATIETEMELRVEPEMPEETVAGLRKLGHKVVRRNAGVYDGKVQLIVIDQERQVLLGAADPRGDGLAAAF